MAAKFIYPKQIEIDRDRLELFNSVRDGIKEFLKHWPIEIIPRCIPVTKEEIQHFMEVGTTTSLNFITFQLFLKWHGKQQAELAEINQRKKEFRANAKAVKSHDSRITSE